MGFHDDLLQFIPCLAADRGRGFHGSVESDNIELLVVARAWPMIASTAERSGDGRSPTLCTSLSISALYH